MEIKRLVLSPLSTNCYIVKTGENSGVIIDPADKAKTIIREAEKMGIVNIEGLLLTHGHFDHFSAAADIIKEIQSKEIDEAKKAAKNQTEAVKAEAEKIKKEFDAAKDAHKKANEELKAAKADVKTAADKDAAKALVEKKKEAVAKAEELKKEKEKEKKAAEENVKNSKFDKDNYKPSDVAVYIHESDAEMLTDANKSLAFFCPTIGFAAVKNSIQLTDSQKLTIGNITFEVMHTPGHSAGSICYIVKEEGKNHMFSGDTIFRDSIGRSDGYSGDYIIQKETLKKIRDLKEDYFIYPGHGEFTTLSDEKVYNPFINGQYQL